MNKPFNIITNSAFDNWVGGTSFSSSADDVVTAIADDWNWVQSDGAAGTIATTAITRQAFDQSLTTNPPQNPKYYMRIANTDAGTALTTDAYMTIQQLIADVRSVPPGYYVQISFWAKSNVAGQKIAAEIRQYFGTGGSPASTVNCGDEAFSLSTTWQKYTTLPILMPSITLPTALTIGSNEDSSVHLNFFLQAGSTYAARAGGNSIAWPTAAQLSIYGVEMFVLGQSSYQIPQADRPISLREVTKRVQLAGSTLNAFTASGTITMGSGINIATNTGTGTIIGVTSSQRLGFWGATAIVQPANTVDYVTMLTSIGLRATGGTAAATFPGALSCAALTSTSVAATGDIAATGHITMTDAKNIVINATTGTKIGTGTSQKIGFWNTTPAVQQTGIAATTDNSTGSAGDTVAAGAGVTTLTFPFTFTTSTSAIDVVTNYVPGYKFKVLGWSWIDGGTLLVGASGSRVANMEIGSTDVGTVPSTCTVVQASTATGRKIDGTAVSGANTGTSSDTLSIEIASGGTDITAGNGSFVIRIQNMDTADAIASFAAKLNTMRTADITVGLTTTV